jgi:succinate dehydrogenase / fumarate reductase cytochrome b subunit
MSLATRTPAALWRTSVGKKAVMAVTGVILILFVIAHMVGNFKVFLGATHFDEYSDFLRTIGYPILGRSWYLWLQRAGLIAAVVLHMTAAYQLTVMARRARPLRYQHTDHVAATYAARTMRWGGVIIMLFAIYHILDLTTGQLNPAADKQHPYANVVADFAASRWYVTLFYALAILAIGFHLRHGIFSAVRTLGQQTQRGQRRARAAALAIAVVLCAGYLSVPFAVLTGLVR